MIVVTGGTGLVGSNLVRTLNATGRSDIVVVDAIGESEKWRNLEGTGIADFFNYRVGPGALETAVHHLPLDAVFHIGANADVLVRDGDRMLEENFEHSKAWFQISQKHGIPFLYASSSAVYGNSPECRTSDECERPHNPYAFSKWLFDRYIRDQMARGLHAPVLGFRLFNVFGPGEAHKGANASLPRRFLGFLREHGRIDLFQGDIRRDYVAVNAVTAVLLDAWRNGRPTGIFNLGAGTAISHSEVAEMAIAAARRSAIPIKGSGIEVIPMPSNLIRSFQFRTLAQQVPDWILTHTANNRAPMEEYLQILAR